LSKILDTLGTALERQPYFAPKLGRDMATLILQYGDQRCFLIRSRSTANDAHEAPYAISFKTPGNQIQHMRIYTSQTGPVKYWLCRNDKFSSVPVLIDAYKHTHDLNTAFPDLNGYLGISAIAGHGRLRYFWKKI